MTIEEFIEKHRLVMHRVKVPARQSTHDAWERTATHWHVAIAKTTGPDDVFRLVAYGQPHLATYYSQGSAHTKPPKLADVLDSLASDASGTFGTGFEGWASEHGYDTDSRKALATYEACRKIAGDLNALLGADAVEALLYQVERL